MEPLGAPVIAPASFAKVYDEPAAAWAWDEGENDTFRIHSWIVDASGNQTVIYRRGSELALGGGAVVIKEKQRA